MLLKRDDSILELEKLIKEVESAHLEYEEKLGKKDKDWPVWFAKFIIKKTYDI